ncbi:MAG: 16S rRNA (guanine(527)-N(7))-methyltransferase RsmG [Nitrospira sp.]|nr:16S rRNA (guanine(527)-N(7))-methyltransferase RsmG [Nitrospira sp.]
MEQATSPSLLLQESSAEIGVPLSIEQVQRFMVYLKQLQLWNQSFNLTSITLDDEIIIKHFVDSLAALRADDIRPGSKVLDVGTGAGFPGIPLKIARLDLNITLIEPARKKSSFLHFIIGLLRLESVDIFDGTLERFLNERLPYGSFDYLTTRALKHDLILHNGTRLLRPGGKAILYSSQPINQSDLSSNWLLMSEYTFQLQKGYGQRVVSLAIPASLNQNVFDVPRGTNLL